MKYISLLFFSALLWLYNSFGQQENPGLDISRMQFQAKQVIPPSPEAAELGKYGNVPVSLFTGTPNVSIPLVELKGNFLSLPVSLSYNHSGFKPDEIAPWTGLGWALNASGVITRSVMGDPDMNDNYYRFPSPLDPVPDDELLKQMYYSSMKDKQIETQPDIYYYNFMGKSGKFMIGPDSSIVSKEKSYLSVVRWMGPESEWIFIIIDEQGFRYEFMELEETQINPVDDQPNAPPMVVRKFVSSWYLSKIIAPNGNEELEFEYYSPEQAQSTMSGSLTNNSITYTKSEYISIPPDVSVSYWQFFPPTTAMYTFQHPGTSIWKKYIKKATLRKNNITIGHIDFESDINARDDLGDADFNGERRLKTVKLYSSSNGSNTLIKVFELGYGNFGASQQESPGFYRRLKLKTVREISTDTTVTPSKPAYTFYYHGENFAMPPRFTSGLDHWGYYNGQTNMHGSSPTLIPTVNVAGIEHISGDRGLGANREPDPLNAKLTVLERIDYPTGGYTTFDYEGHIGSIYSSTQSNIPTGGLRIKQIVDHSFSEKPAMVKKYEYQNEDGTTSGQIAYYPYYYTTSIWTNYNQCHLADPVFRRVVKTYNATISASSSFGLGSIQGSHIGYRRVTEYITDLATSKSLGKTVYTYDMQGLNEIDPHIGNGELLKQQVFDNGDKLLEELTNEYTYEDFLNERVISRKLLSQFEQSTLTLLLRKVTGGDTIYTWHAPFGCNDIPPGFGVAWSVPSQSYHTENYIHQQRKKLDLQTSKVFDPATNTYLSTTKTFTYGNPDHNYPTLIAESDSKTDKVYTAIKYVADFTISCSPAAAPGSMADAISEMKGKNMWGIPIEKLQYRENPEVSNRRYISGEFIQHKSGLPEKIYYLQVNPMPTNVTMSEASCNPATQSIDPNYRIVATLAYDGNMNLKEESKTNDVVTTYLWGYNGQYPVAKVVGKTHSESLASGINQAVLDNPSSENALRTELDKLRSMPVSLVSSSTYKPMVGISSSTDARGQMITYEYDALNRLVHVKEDGNIIQNIKYNYGLGTAPATSPQSLFYNLPIQQDFTKQGCPTGMHGEVVSYIVPYGRYASAINLQDANDKAASDMSANGQSHANSKGQCFWHNEEVNQFVFKNDCLPDEGPPVSVMYTIEEGKYKSLVSQEDADAMADADIATLGQEYANTLGTCSCVGVGKKWINGVCETGTMTMVGGYYDNGQWICVYYYVFSDNSTSEYYYTYQSFPCPTGS